MWKLTIEQERKSKSSDYTFTNKIEFVNDDLAALTMIIAQLADCDEVDETSYKIEKVGEE